jgi:hypothetical protein
MNTLKILSMLFILIINIFPQQKDTINNTDAINNTKWSVQFQVGNDFTLQSFDGLIISLKYHFTPKFAVRLGTGANFRTSDNELDYRGYYYNEYVKATYEQNSTDFALISNFLYYPRPAAFLKVFFGAGPRAGYTCSSGERLYLDGYKAEYDNWSWSAGVNAVFGCEWFPMKSLGLFGEYSVYALYSEAKVKEYIYEIKTRNPAEYYYRTSKEIQFRGNIARLGASFYF